MYVVTVDFTVAQGRGEAFLAAIVANARTSREMEPGCRQFDVCVDPDDSLRVFLYERYVDGTTFAAHLASGHFKDFDAKVAPWVVRKTVQHWTQLDDA
jgi:quinol monooxygenase YgiN